MNYIPIQFNPIQWTPCSYFFYLRPALLFPFFYIVVFQVFLEVFQLCTFYYIVRFTRATIYSIYIKIYLHYRVCLSIIDIYTYIYIYADGFWGNSGYCSPLWLSQQRMTQMRICLPYSHQSALQWSALWWRSYVALRWQPRGQYGLRRVRWEYMRQHSKQDTWNTTERKSTTKHQARQYNRSCLQHSEN